MLLNPHGQLTAFWYQAESKSCPVGSAQEQLEQVRAINASGQFSHAELGSFISEKLVPLNHNAVPLAASLKCGKMLTVCVCVCVYMKNPPEVHLVTTQPFHKKK